jgi:hypothetical protein
MKELLRCRLLVMTGTVVLALAGPAFANHRTGDLPLPELIVAADLNEDGKLDLAVNVAGFDNVAILNGDGQANFTLTEHVETDTLPKGLAVADVNGDHHLDLVSINQWGYDIRINLGDGRGGFSGTGTELNGDGEPIRIAVADLNNDHNLDLIANAPSEGKILIYFGRGHGAFSTSALELEDVPHDYEFAVGDVNRDGNVDIVVVESDQGPKAVVFLGDGAGNFTRANEFPVTVQSPIVLVDLNHDGNLDILNGGAGAENQSGMFLAAYLGDGTGNFTAGQINDLGPGVMEGLMGLGDFNEDGNVDVAFPVVFSQTPIPSTSVLVFLGDGNGGFTQGQTITSGTGPHSVAAADFNSDGHIDLAVTNRDDGTVLILLGVGDGTFTSHSTIPIAVVPAP